MTTGGELDEALASSWAAAWSAAGAGGDGRAVLDDLLARYGEPHRAYHTLDHIRFCLAQLDLPGLTLAAPVLVTLALWFHDAVYDPRRHDNERRSAELAAAALTGHGAPADAVDDVTRYVLLTTHGSEPLDGDAAVVCDADLAILGADPEQFARYDAQIRDEYAWVPADVYQRERGRVLAGFLARPRIYQTDAFAERYEAQARANLGRALLAYQA